MKQIANDILFGEVEKAIKAGGCVELLVAGNSMMPMLRNGEDTAVLSPCHTETLAVGDIVLFRYKGRHILHRIVALDDDGVTMAGDGNYRIREHCSRSDVIAVMRCVIRKNGRSIDCHSLRWRMTSRGWLILPPLLRRYIMSLLYRTIWRAKRQSH